MSNTVIINKEEILQQVKTSLDIPKITQDISKRKVVKDHAERLGLVIDDQEIQDAADVLRVANNISNASDTWQWLEEHGLSLEDFESIINITILSQKLANHLFADKVEKHFFDRCIDYAEATIYEVIFDDEDVALDYFYSIKEGEVSFFEVANQCVKDEEIRKMCGYKGTIARSSLKPELSSAIFSTVFDSTPKLLKPINTQVGCHLILLESINEKNLNNQIRVEILSDLFEEWLEQQVKTLKLIYEIQ
jgi:hypothetical protein